MAECVGGVIVKKETCERLLAECELAFQKMGLDLYEIMRQAPAIVERLKPYHQTAQKVWENARNCEEALRFWWNHRIPTSILCNSRRFWGLFESFRTFCAAVSRTPRKVCRRLLAVAPVN